MRGESSCCRDPWPSSKCQRILRPLKLKITALERALSTSYSVSDGLSSWSTQLDQQRKFRDKSGTDSSSAYNPASTRIKKYGTARKQLAAGRARGGTLESHASADEMLASLRVSVSPHLASAYIGVYYAFRTILDKADSNERFPSLASRAALTVGRCVHLTGSQFTETPIEADDWYEAAPSHLRAAVVLGHAVQILISSSLILGPLMPVLTLCMKQTPSASDMLDAVLQSTNLSSCRKADLQALQSLAEQIGTPWALRAHVTRDLKVEYLGHPPFSVLLDTKKTGHLDDYTSALYVKSNTVALTYLRKRSGRDEARELKVLNTLEDICQRVIESEDTQLVSCLGNLWCGTTETRFIALGMVYSLATLANDSEDTVLIKAINTLSEKLIRCSMEEKQESARYIIDTFGSEKIVAIVEMLIGRINDLGTFLADQCAFYLQGDFNKWADDIKMDVTRARCDGNSDKYRFEPLLDSWVARTPGLHKIKSRKIFADVEDTDEDSSSIDEEDYDADFSRTQLTFVEIECEDEDDLMAAVTSPRGKLGHKVLEILSAKKPSQKLLSARVLRCYSRVDPHTVPQKSPLASKSTHDLSTPSKTGEPFSSRLKRVYSDSAEEEDDDDLSLQRNIMPGWRKRSKLSVTGKLAEVSASPFIGRSIRKPLRELNNLKSSFISLGEKRRRRKRQPEASLPFKVHVDPIGDGVMAKNDDDDDDDDTSDDIQDHPRSEYDELSLL